MEVHIYISIVQYSQLATLENTEYTEWQWLLSGVHFIMMVKSAQPGEGGGVARPPPFTLSTITSKVVVFIPAERADTLPLFLLYPNMHSVFKKQQEFHCDPIEEAEASATFTFHTWAVGTNSNISYNSYIK
jgi:hypothetical protein